MDGFIELSKATLARILAFGIKSRTVIKAFERSCRLFRAFLQENGLKFSSESADQWLSEFEWLKEGSLYQRNLYLSHRRALLLLLSLQNGQLDEWKIYRIKTTQRPTNAHYTYLLDQYKQHLILEGISGATMLFSMRVASMFFCYLESIKIDNIRDLAAIHVSDFWGRDLFSDRKPKGVQAYAYKLKKLWSSLRTWESLVISTFILQSPKFLRNRFQ